MLGKTSGSGDAGGEVGIGGQVDGGQLLDGESEDPAVVNDLIDFDASGAAGIFGVFQFDDEPHVGIFLKRLLNFSVICAVPSDEAVEFLAAFAIEKAE